MQCVCVYCVKSLGSRDWRGRGRGGGRDGEQKKVILPRAISLFKSVLAIQLRLACVSHYNGWQLGMPILVQLQFYLTAKFGAQLLFLP